jgi:hypothetical protein
MKESIELFRSVVGSVIVPVAQFDPDLRRSPVRSAVVVYVAVSFGVLVVGTALAYKNVTTVRDFLTGAR